MKKTRIITVVILLGLFIGCREEEVFPSVTQEGKNTFGLKIDGKVWLPKQSLSIVTLPKLSSSYHIDGGIFGITARKGVGDEIFTFTISNVQSVGLYSFNVDANDGVSPTSYTGDMVEEEYFLKQGGVNEVEITKLDTIDKIVSGVFKCQLKAKNKRSLLNITDGVFDVRYDD